MVGISREFGAELMAQSHTRNVIHIITSEQFFIDIVRYPTCSVRQSMRAGSRGLRKPHHLTISNSHREFCLFHLDSIVSPNPPISIIRASRRTACENARHFPYSVHCRKGLAYIGTKTRSGIQFYFMVSTVRVLGSS
jgi:hypothetical protein